MKNTEVLPVGIVVERRKIDHPWRDWAWKVIDIVVGSPPLEDWTVLRSGEGWTWFHAATSEIELHAKEAEAYVFNMKAVKPAIYVVLTDDEDIEAEIALRVHLVTASPYEAQDYLDSGEDMVESMEMPPEIVAWIDDFIAKHYVEEPFIKRQRDKQHPDDYDFGQEPIVDIRKRQMPQLENE